MSTSQSNPIGHLESIGRAVKQTRLEQSLTQEQVGHRLGLTQKDFSRIERGEHAISIERFWQVAQALNINPSELLQLAESMESNQTTK